MTDTVNVPREPTREMLEAFFGCAEVSWSGSIRNVEDAYRAMLAAAPKAEPVGNPHQLPEAHKVEQETVVCHHEAYQGSCAHCGVKIVNGLAVRHKAHPAPSSELLEALEEIEDEAGRYAAMYPHGSDGRNTFLIFADGIAQRIAKHKRPQS